MKNSSKLKGFPLSIFSLLALFALGIFLYSCQKEKIISSEEELNQDPLIQQIISMGFREDMIIDRGDYFQVEGDIVITKDGLRKGHYNYKSELNGDSLILTTGERHRRTSILIKYHNIRGITVRIDNSLNTPQFTWIGLEFIVRQAIQDWNNTGSQVNLVFTTAANADITIRSDFGALDPGAAADASIPSAGKPGAVIRLNVDATLSNFAFFTSGLYQDEVRFAIAHELGHTLGLLHTGDRRRGAHIEGTPDTERNSVMNLNPTIEPWNGFSSGDIAAIRALYPVCPSGWTYDGANCYSGIHFPTEYNPFIYPPLRGFYVQQKPNCTPAQSNNNCCPPGYQFDQANCHSTVSYPLGWTPFIYGNSFYIFPSHL